jgi:hypothetical protein
VFDWYWGLSGITWFITTFLMGAIPIAFCGAFVILMAKSIAKSTDHNPQVCPCERCENRRARAINAKYEKRQPWVPDEQTGNWISTAELEEHMVIITRQSGEPYRVTYIEPRQYGYVLILRNMNTNRQSWLTVPYKSAHKKMWKLAEGKTRRVYGL